MDIEELVAWLNPGTARLGGGRGGIPTLTPQDVAAAIGIARSQEPLGAEMLLQRSAPELAAQSQRARQSMILERVLREHRARMTEIVRSREALTIAELRLELKTGTRLDVQSARESYEKAKAKCWPALGKGWARIVRMLDAEMCADGKCKHCNGTGVVATKGDGGLTAMVTCGHCRGTGMREVSARARARAYGVDESTWRRTWAAAYDWLWSECQECRQRARRIASEALRG